MRESNRHPLLRSGALTAALLLGLTGLTACGDSEVSGTGDALLTDNSRQTSSTSSPSSSTNPARPSELPEDYPGPSTIMRTTQDKEYLQDLKSQGIVVDGVEDSLIGTGKSLCQGKAETGRLNPVLARAVAGQLAQQGKTTQDTQQTTDILTRTAIRHYCR